MTNLNDWQDRARRMERSVMAQYLIDISTRSSKDTQDAIVEEEIYREIDKIDEE